MPWHWSCKKRPGAEATQKAFCTQGISPTDGTFQFALSAIGPSDGDFESLLGLPPGTIDLIGDDGSTTNGPENATIGSLLVATLAVTAGAKPLAPTLRLQVGGKVARSPPDLNVGVRPGPIAIIEDQVWIAQGGEFGLVLLSLATQEQLLPHALGQFD